MENEIGIFSVNVNGLNSPEKRKKTFLRLQKKKKNGYNLPSRNSH